MQYKSVVYIKKKKTFYLWYILNKSPTCISGDWSTAAETQSCCVIVQFSCPSSFVFFWERIYSD